MRVVFAGTPEFARLALEAIDQAGHEIVLVMSQPDRPSGRGLKLTPSAVKSYALAHHLPVAQPLSLRLDGKYPDEAKQAFDTLQALQPDVMIVAAYGLILPQWVLDLPKFGCLNIHASLLPRWRGAAPIQRAIQSGDKQTGITIMQMDAGLDTGDALLMESMDIAEQNAASLHDALAQMGATLVVQALHRLENNVAMPATPQATQGVCYAEKLSKAEAILDWNQSADTLVRSIRAFNPAPGASVQLPELGQVKVWQAEKVTSNSQKAAGEFVAVSEAGLDVACADGVVRLLEIQKPGSKRQDVASFVRGWKR